MRPVSTISLLPLFTACQLVPEPPPPQTPPPGPPAGFPYCGDGKCTFGETIFNCAEDCLSPPPVCGDGVCELEEDCGTCSADCGVCPPPPVRRRSSSTTRPAGSSIAFAVAGLTGASGAFTLTIAHLADVCGDGVCEASEECDCVADCGGC